MSEPIGAGDLPNNKSELLERIQAAWELLEDDIGSLSDEQMEAPRGSGWAVKDHLSHLAAWELGVAELLHSRSRFTAMQVEDAVLAGKSEDEVNAAIFERYRGLSSSEALHFLRDSHQRMVAAIEELDSADLFRPYSYFLPPGEKGPDDPVIHWIVGNTYEHFDLHRGYLKE